MLDTAAAKNDMTACHPLRRHSWFPGWEQVGDHHISLNPVGRRRLQSWYVVTSFYRLGLTLELVVRWPDANWAEIGKALLHNVGQFVSDELSAPRGPWPVGAWAEDNVSTCGKGPGSNGRGGFICLCVGVHADVTEIVAEPCFHDRPRWSVQRLSRLSQNVMDNGRERWESPTPNCSAPEDVLALS